MKRFTRSKKFKFWVGKKTFVFSKPEIRRLLTDKLKRSANLQAPLYKCRIFKKCNNYTNRKNRKKSQAKENRPGRRQKGSKRKGRRGNKRRRMGKKKRAKNKRKNNFNRAAGFKIKDKPKKTDGTKKIGNTGLFRGGDLFGL